MTVGGGIPHVSHKGWAGYLRAKMTRGESLHTGLLGHTRQDDLGLRRCITSFDVRGHGGGVGVGCNGDTRGSNGR